MSVSEVAVMAERQVPGSRRSERGLGVFPHTRAGRGIARVPDSNMTMEGIQGRFSEHLRDQAHVLVNPDIGAITDSDTC